MYHHARRDFILATRACRFLVSAANAYCVNVSSVDTASPYAVCRLSLRMTHVIISWYHLLERFYHILSVIMFLCVPKMLDPIEENDYDKMFEIASHFA